MATARKSARSRAAARGASPPPEGNEPSGYEGSDGLTPGFLVTFRDADVKQGLAMIRDHAGIASMAMSSDFSDGDMDAAQFAGADGIVFERLGVAVLNAAPDQVQGLSAAAAGDDVVVEQEPIFFAAGGTGISPADYLRYLRGYHDAVTHLYEALGGTGEGAGAPGEMAEEIAAAAGATWGLQVTGVLNSRFTGRGVRVAVLDTGMDLDHPDFLGRTIVSRSFIAGQAVQDENGHGTHCIGTACGPANPGIGPRYGVASGADIFAGKVLSNQGSSLGRSTLAGIEWALANKCQVISMSLSGRVAVGDTFLTAFETVGRRALRQGALIVAAAGNDSRRGAGRINPVGSPANAPSIMAVAALDSRLRVGDFSNAGRNPLGGQVDIAGPGVEVYSAAPEPAPTPQPPFFRRWTPLHDTISGTSMATPHVAGIAALWLESNRQASALELWQILTSRARRLNLAGTDVGAGLVQAP